MFCPHKHPKRKGPCRGQLELVTTNGDRPGWSTYECQTCKRKSMRNDSLHKPKRR